MIDPVLASRWVFIALCGYIASQAYTVPIVPIGPWPLWPGLPDISLAGLIVAWLIMPRSTRELVGVRRTVLQVTFLLTMVCGASYLVFTLLVSNLDTISFGANQQGPAFGLFEFVRLIQFLILFRIALSIPYTQFRLAVLRRIVSGVFFFVCVSVIATFHNSVPTSTLVPLLPRDMEAGGAWSQYVHNPDGYGLGAISYNHAYVAAQITLLLGLTLHLRGGRQSVVNSLLIAMALVATVLSGSRAGFAGVLLLAACFLLARSPRWLVHLALVLMVFGAGTVIYISSQPPSGEDGGPLVSIVEHQLNAFQPFETGNLVGRDEIWSGRIDNLHNHPWRWFTGWGFGSSPDTGPGLSPHMLPLQVIMELGVGVFILVVLICASLLHNVWSREDRDHPFFWMTIALLLSSTTQETFYPVPSTGYFLGFFLVALAITLRPQTDPFPVPTRVGSAAAPRPPAQLAPGLNARA